MTTVRRNRFFFFLNPYADMAFTRCPKCETMTKLRKIPLVIHVEPRTLRVLNKICRFCPACELVIAKRAEIEPMLQAMIDDGRVAIERSKYLVVGTLDRVDWRAARKGQWSPADALERAWLFRNHWEFVVTCGWQRANDRPPR